MNEERFMAAVQRVRKFSDDRDWKQFHTPENLAKSIAIEAGELLECFQWTPDGDRQAVAEELADVLAYCIHLADEMDLDIADILQMKMEQNEKKYPVELSKGNNKKYTELDTAQSPSE